MNIKKLIVPFILIIVLVTIRVSTLISNDTYYDNFKIFFKREIDIIGLSKRFLGKFEELFIKDNDYNVSSNEVYYELNDGKYYVVSDTNKLTSKISGVCIGMSFEGDKYNIKIQTDSIIITYYQLESVNVKLYDYINTNDYIADLSFDNTYYYVVEYEN